MKSTLVKQMWAQRKSNGWIFIELIIIFVISWMVIDPIYVIEYQRKGIKYGFEPKDLYFANIRMYASIAPDFDSTRISSEALHEDLNRLVNTVKSLKDVEAVAPVDQHRPFGGAFTGNNLLNPEDSTNVQIQILQYLTGYDYFKTFRFRSALDHSWESLDSLEVPTNGVIITEDAQEKLFGNNPAIGKSLTYYSGPRVVSAVIENIKRSPSSKPYRVAIMPIQSFHVRSFGSIDLIIRVRPGISETKFISDFNKEMSNKLYSGNLYYTGNIQRYNDAGEQYSRWDDSDKTIRLRAILSVFFLIVVFLGVVSTFWLRVETRKEEIGIRMALGSTGKKIRTRLLGESTLLVLFSAIIGLIIMVNIVYFKGLYTFGTQELTCYPAIDNTVLHFAIVSLIVLTIMLLTVTIATAIPASRASKINPIDALRDE